MPCAPPMNRTLNPAASSAFCVESALSEAMSSTQTPGSSSQAGPHDGAFAGDVNAGFEAHLFIARIDSGQID